MAHVALVHDPIDPTRVLSMVGDDADGAAVLFLGVARNHADARAVRGMRYEAYEEMAAEVLADIASEASRLLGTDTIQPVALVGMGNLGRAILAYRGFEERGFHIAVIFDVDSEKVGRVFAGRRCFHLKDLETVLPDYQPTIAILACGAQGLQNIVDRLGKSGVRGIINFVPKKITPVRGMYLEDVDISAKMEKISFLLRAKSGEGN